MKGKRKAEGFFCPPSFMPMGEEYPLQCQKGSSKEEMLSETESNTEDLLFLVKEIGIDSFRELNKMVFETKIKD